MFTACAELLSRVYSVTKLYAPLGFSDQNPACVFFLIAEVPKLMNGVRTSPVYAVPPAIARSVTSNWWTYPPVVPAKSLCFRPATCMTARQLPLTYGLLRPQEIHRPGWKR